MKKAIITAVIPAAPVISDDARGVMDANSRTRTTALGGQFKSDARTRGEFLS